MEVADHVVETGGVQVRVDLGGLDAGMAEQLEGRGGLS
jgi:flagellar biosynthesis/type III secretory pathway protein FliH